MNKRDYLGRKESEKRKPNGHFTKQAVREMEEKTRDAIEKLRSYWYTSPAYYGMHLMNCPLNKHGKRVLRVTNF